MPAAFVVEQVIAVHRGDVEIVPAVVIVIAHRDAHAVDFDIETAAPRDVRERAAIALVKSRRGVPAARNPVLAVQQQGVQFTVAIRVEKRHAGAHRFRQPLLARASRVVGEPDARRRRHIGEADRNRSALRGLTVQRREQHREQNRQRRRSQKRDRESTVFHCCLPD